ncbi:MAG: type IV secretory system conjugative DNA transfer family protein [Hyphomicrobiaceae bacterium]
MARRARPAAAKPSKGILLGFESDQGRHRPESPSASSPRPIWREGEGHLLTIAPTGTGKGTGCIIPALLTWDGPAVVIDPKGENYAVTADRRQKLGQKVAVLDPFGITGAARHAALNPFDILSGKADMAADDAAVIARLSVQGSALPRDPFWDERAETLIAGLILHVARTARLERRNLGEVRRLIELPDKQHDKLAVELRQSSDAGITAAASILEMHASNTRSGILSTAASHLSFLRGQAVQDSLASSSIKLAQIAQGAPLTIYLVVPPDRLVSHGKLLRLWLGMLMTIMARRRRVPDRPTLLIVDEAAQLGPMDELRSAVTLMRGYGVKVWSFWQDLSQLVRTYPVDWPSFLNNASAIQVFGIGNSQGASDLEAYFSYQARAMLDDMAPDETLVIERGMRPRLLLRPNYLDDPELAGYAKPNPFYRGRRPPAKTKANAHVAGANVIVFPRAKSR